MQFLAQLIWWHATRPRFPHAPPLPPLPGHTHVVRRYNGRSARRHALCSDAKIGRWCVVVGAAQILARSAFLALARAGHSATGNLISVAAASAGMAKGSTGLTGRVGLTAIGAVKTAPRAGVVFRARLIAVTGAQVASRAVTTRALTMRAASRALIAASGGIVGRVALGRRAGPRRQEGPE